MTTSRSMLVYGATGRAGRLVVERALVEGWAVSVFVRNPDKLPDTLRSRITIVKGDLCDAASVFAVVRSSRPNAIIDASSALPFGHTKGQPANNADRGVLTKATVEALHADGRLADCVLLVIGGQLIPEPGGTIDKLSVAAVAWVLRTFVMRRGWREAQEVLRWCFHDAPPGFRIVYARLGHMVDEPSRGSLGAEPTANNIQRGSASYCDVADALVRLASDQEWNGKRTALFFNYVGT